MTDKKLPKVYDGEIVPPRADGTAVPVRADTSSVPTRPGLLSSLGNELRNKAGARSVAAANAYAEQVNRSGELAVHYQQLVRQLAVEQDKNSPENITAYKDAARGEIVNKLLAQDAERADLKRRQEEADAAAAKLKAGLVADQTEEQNRQLAAELQRLRLQAAIEEERKKLDAQQHDRAQLLQTVETQIETLQQQKSQAERDLATLNDPAFDNNNDPGHAMKVSVVVEALEMIETALAAAVSRAESLR